MGTSNISHMRTLHKTSTYDPSQNSRSPPRSYLVLKKHLEIEAHALAHGGKGHKEIEAIHLLGEVVVSVIHAQQREGGDCHN
jgi:hypothetical protein